LLQLTPQRILKLTIGFFICLTLIAFDGIKMISYADQPLLEPQLTSDANQSESVTYNIPLKPITCVLTDEQNNRLYIGTTKGLIVLDRLTHKRLFVIPLIGIQCIAQAPNGKILIGTTQGLFSMNHGKVMHIKQHVTNITSMCVDNDGGVWLGSHDGLIHLSDMIQTDQNIPEQQVTRCPSIKVVLFIILIIILIVTLIVIGMVIIRKAIKPPVPAKKSLTVFSTDDTKKLLEANKKLMDSIQYATAIQKSLLPNLGGDKLYLPSSFVIWMPKDIVGGDMFLKEKFDHGLIFAVIDCTGHGVPGAFMTMIAASGLRRIIKDDSCFDPAEILKRLNVIIKTTLHQDTDEAISDDGLDAALCFVSFKDKTLTFAGANLQLAYISQKKVTVLKGDKQSIGYKNSKKSDINFTFSNRVIPLKKGMTFYLATDGYYDQVGGEKGFSFGRKRFYALMKKISTESFERQREILLEEFHAYKNDREMQDDVTVIGFSSDVVDIKT